MRISKTFWKNKFSATVFSVEPSEVILNLTDDELVFVAGRLCFLPDVIVQECHIISFLIKKTCKYMLSYYYIDKVRIGLYLRLNKDIVNSFYGVSKLLESFKYQ